MDWPFAHLCEIHTANFHNRHITKSVHKARLTNLSKFSKRPRIAGPVARERRAAGLPGDVALAELARRPRLRRRTARCWEPIV